MIDMIQTVPAAPGAGGAPATPEQMRHAAEEFEAVFLAQMLSSMTKGLEGEGGPLGGEDDPFRGMLSEEIGKLISRSGGIGLADSVLQEMLKMQEVA